MTWTVRLWDDVRYIFSLHPKSQWSHGFRDLCILAQFWHHFAFIVTVCFMCMLMPKHSLPAYTNERTCCHQSLCTSCAGSITWYLQCTVEGGCHLLFIPHHNVQQLVVPANSQDKLYPQQQHTAFSCKMFICQKHSTNSVFHLLVSSGTIQNL